MRKLILTLVCVAMLFIAGCSTAANKATLKTTGPDYVKDQSQGPTEIIIIEYVGGEK